MAGFDNTNVITPDGNTTVLNLGENLVVQVLEGDTVSSDRPIQVDLVAGDAPSDYELRWYAQVDSSEWSNEYISPVAETFTGTAYWFYNPKDADLTVNFEGGNTNSGSFIVPAMASKLVVASDRATDEILIGSNDVETGVGFAGQRTASYSGVRFSASDVFYGLVQVDHGYGGATGRLYDWGFPMIPTSQLTSAALVGLGYGCTDNVCDATGERSLIWVTPVDDTIIFVDYDGNGFFDETFNVTAYSSLRLTNPNGVDMTGAIIASSTKGLPDGQPDLTGLPVKIAVVWGQDPRRSGSRDKYGLDLGTAVLPLANPFVSKQVVGVNNPDGSPDFRLLVDQVGDVILYEISVSNVGFGSLTAVDVEDNLIDDTLTGPVESFLPPNGVLQRGETFIYSGFYVVTADDIATLGGGDSIISNTATIRANTIPPVTVSVDTPIALTNISGTVFEDTDGDDVGDVVIENVLVTLTTDTGSATTLTNDEGFYKFTDLQAGNYTVEETNLDGTYTDVSPNLISLTIIGGPEYTGNNFVDERLGSVDGTVLDEAGAPIPGVTITLEDLSTNGTVTSITDATGAYEFTNVRPGNYSLVEVNLDSFPTSLSDQDTTPDGDDSDSDTTVDDTILVSVRPTEKDDGNDFVDIRGSGAPSSSPSAEPSASSELPSVAPSALPSITPSSAPSSTPSITGSSRPSSGPSSVPSLIDSASPSLLPTTTPSFSPSLAPIFKAPKQPDNCCVGQENNNDTCEYCIPYRSPDFCPREQSFPALISTRTSTFRNNATDVEDAGYWFHYLEDKIAGYLLSTMEGVPTPQVYCCVTDMMELPGCLTSSIPSGQTNIVIKSTNFHSSEGVYVLTNFTQDAVNNPSATYMRDLIKGMATSYADVISELSEKEASKIIVEEFIGDTLPIEYKFHVVNGQVAAVDIIADRGGDCPCYAVIGLDGGRLDNYGCFEPGGLEIMNDQCYAIDFLTGRNQCGPVKKDLFICDDLPVISECQLLEMADIAIKLGEAIGVYMRVDMFVVGEKFYVQEYSANHMNGLRHCAAKPGTKGCIDSCFLGREYDTAGAPYGGVAVPVPIALKDFRTQSPQAQCDMVAGVTVPSYDFSRCNVGAPPDGVPDVTTEAP